MRCYCYCYCGCGYLMPQSSATPPIAEWFKWQGDHACIRVPGYLMSQSSATPRSAQWFGWHGDFRSTMHTYS